MSMKELKTHIRKNGFDYEQVVKSDKGYIYSQRLGSKIVAYEVFKRVENKYYNCISFPGNEAFGDWAWTYPTLELAEKKLNNI